MSELLSIPNCIATQVIGVQDDVPLSQGTLTLLKSSSGDLSLTCGSSAFALRKNTPWYTHTDSERIYLFKPDIEISAGTFIKILLPEEINDPNGAVAKQRDELESFLIEHGYLKEAASAAGDEIGRSIKESATALSSKILGAAERHTASHPAGDSQLPLPVTSAAESTVSFTEKAADYAHTASSYVNDTAKKVGSKISEVMPDMSGVFGTGSGEKSEVRKQAEDVGEGVKTAASGFGSGVSQVYNASTTATHDVISHDFGKQAQDLSEKSGQAAGNLGSVGVEGLKATSAVFNAGKAAEGAHETN